MVKCQRQVTEILRDDEISGIRGCLWRTFHGVGEENYGNVVAARIPSRLGIHSNQFPETDTDSCFLLCLSHCTLLYGFSFLQDSPWESPGPQKGFFPSLN